MATTLIILPEMRNYFFRNLPICFISLLIGCVQNNNDNNISRKDFKLTFILTAPLSATNENKYPGDFSGLFLPYSNGHQNSFFVPNLNFERFDFKINYSYKPDFTNIGGWTSLMRSLGNNTNNPNSIKGDILGNIESQIIPDSLLIKGSKVVELPFLLDSLSAGNNNQVIIFSKPFKDSIITLSQKTYRVFSDTNTIKKYICNLLCKNGGAGVEIVYEPTLNFSPPPPPHDTGSGGYKHDKKNVRIHEKSPSPPPPHGKGHGNFIIDCGTYDGDTYDGKPNGAGTMYYSQSCRISKYDNKERNTEAGDYITGHWKDGYLDVGTWYDKNGKEKAVLTIGVHQ